MYIHIRINIYVYIYIYLHTILGASIILPLSVKFPHQPEGCIAHKSNGVQMAPTMQEASQLEASRQGSEQRQHAKAAKPAKAASKQSQ